MSVLEDYEKTFGLEPFTPDQILTMLESAEEHMKGCTEAQIRTTGADADRLPIWLSDRLQAVYAALENPRVPVEHRCGWCWRAAGMTEEAWSSLPRMSLDDIRAHAQVCEHNPLVQKVRRLEADFTDALTRAKALSDEATELHARISDLEEKLASSESEVRALTSEVEDLRGRKIGRVDTWAEAASEATGMYDYQRKLHEALKATIRSILATETPAGELRRALGELVR